MPTKKAKTYKRKTIKKRPRQHPLIKKWKKFKPKFLQKIGCLTIFLFVLLGLFLVLVFKWINFSPGQNQDPQTITYQQQANFIEEIAPIAQTLQKEYGILASISMAQAALESNFGESQLSAQYHNLYGVKTEASDPAGVDLPTLEFIDGEMTEMEDRFKVYPDWASSMRAHAELIYYGTTWDPNYYQAVKVGKDYQSQAQGLAEAGYATDPDYAQKLIDMIETWQLDQYDQTSP